MHKNCRYWVHKKHSGTGGKLKEDSKSADTADDCSTIKINNQSLEIMKKIILVTQES